MTVGYQGGFVVRRWAEERVEMSPTEACMHPRGAGQATMLQEEGRI